MYLHTYYISVAASYTAEVTYTHTHTHKVLLFSIYAPYVHTHAYSYLVKTWSNLYSITPWNFFSVRIQVAV